MSPRLLATFSLGALLLWPGGEGLSSALTALPAQITSPAMSAPSTFSDSAASHLLDQIRGGLEGHSQKTLLSAFEISRMTDGVSFRQQIAAFFGHYEAVRVYFKQQKIFMDGAHGVVVIKVDMEATPQGNALPVRKSAELSFLAENGPSGWKFIDVQPRGFFSPELP
ncbi:MAG TPA: hypothetical protein VEW69_07680 [Alphaproteobacteria bacterium]|nr:hypothetical protein [Alphaproteobacteria bacterium]